jgi:hypothetical protein
MNGKPGRVATVVGLAVAVVGTSVCFADEDHESTDLVNHMSRMQYFTHKLGLAISANNQALQGYYLHETEEIIETLSGIKQHQGIEIGQLVQSILLPAFEKLEGRVGSGSQADANAAYNQLIDACNACHQAADHPFIEIERSTGNPYQQSFSARHETQ